MLGPTSFKLKIKNDGKLQILRLDLITGVIAAGDGDYNLSRTIDIFYFHSTNHVNATQRSADLQSGYVFTTISNILKALNPCYIALAATGL